MHSYFRLIKSIRFYIFSFIGAIFCMALLNVLNGFGLMSLVPLVDRVLSGDPVVLTTSLELPYQAQINDFLGIINGMSRIRLLWYISGFILIVFFTKGFFDYYKEVLMERVGQGVVKDIRNSIYQHIQDLSLNFVGKKRSGELVSRITNDVRWVQDGIARGLANTLNSFFELLLYLTILIVIAWKLSVVCFLVFAVLMVPIIKIGKKLRKLSSQGQGKMADITSLLFETISGIRVVKAFGMEKYEGERFSSENNRYYVLMMKAIRRGALLGPLVEFIGAVMAIGVLLLTMQLVITGQLSKGFFVVFIGSLVAIIKPVKKISQMNSIIQRAVAAGDRIYHLLDEKPQITEIKNAVSLKSFNESIKFSNVNFGYVEDEIVLKDINLEVKRGQVVAIVGPSGVGKTTLVNLIPRFYDPIDGVVTVDGINVKEVTLKSLRNQLGIVTQENILFNDTVRSNIAYGDPTRNIEEIVHAAKLANAHQFIEKMPQGYDTVIGERGIQLSGGERQRLSIARAIMKNPPILILDEATSALDTEGERLVQDAINKLMKDRTVVVIAHRLSTIQQADSIVVLKNGQIIQQGRHAELVDQEGLYKKLYEMQFAI